ncbi:BTAD domain-containing putative transcriptional regulator [Streptomyces sp. NPDC059011]|uniref:AfsR/SARP family transcriptional regulator n=1 Tax=unclassified Streptomyces TaxID=2593676 RepID=UPI0036D020BA
MTGSGRAAISAPGAATPGSGSTRPRSASCLSRSSSARRAACTARGALGAGERSARPAGTRGAAPRVRTVCRRARSRPAAPSGTAATELSIGGIENSTHTRIALLGSRTVSGLPICVGAVGLLRGPEPPGARAKVIPVHLHQLRRRPAPGSTVYLRVRDRDRAGWLPLGCAKRPDGRGPTEGTVEEARGARDSGDLAAAVGAWSAALNLFHGEPLSAIPDRFAEAERLRLSEYRHVVVRDKVGRQLRLGRHAEVVAELALSATHPHNESVAALLMRALYAANRQAYALAGFVKVRRRLVEEQRAEPGR